MGNDLVEDRGVSMSGISYLREQIFFIIGIGYYSATVEPVIFVLRSWYSHIRK